MTTSAIRKKLIDYIGTADEKKVRGMYLLFEEEMEKEKKFVLTEEHMKILEAEKEKHLSGKSNSYTMQEANDIIKGKRNL